MNYEGPQLAYLPATREYVCTECGAKVGEEGAMLFSATRHKCAEAKPLDMKLLGNDNMTDAEIVG